MSKEGVILIIDMNESSARQSKDAVEQLCSNKIVITETIANAKKLLDSHEVVFIIVNFYYNNDECFNFIKEVRKNTNARNFKTPILSFIEGNSSISEQDVLDAGSSKCLQKPFSNNQMQDNILDIINNPKNFIMTDNYIGPDRRDKDVEVKEEKRKTR